MELILLLGCAGVEVYGGTPPPVPQGFTVSTFDVDAANDTVRFEVGPSTTAFQLHARVVDPRWNDTLSLNLIEGPAELVGLHLSGSLRPEVTARFPNHPAQVSVPLEGEWAVVLAGPYNREGQVWLLEWTDEDPDQGALVVQVVFTDGMAAQQATVEEALATWSERWSEQGLQVVPWLQSTTAGPDCPSALGRTDLYQELSSAGADHDLTLVICESVDASHLGGANFGGPLVPSPTAAVAVEHDPDPQALGAVMAHHVAHMAGLGHADEDDLSDAPDEHNLLQADTLCAMDDCTLTADQVWMLQNWAGTTIE